jgi:hypothetical protein
MASPIVIWKAVCASARPIGWAASKLRSIPIIDDAVSRLQLGALNPVVVRRVRKTTDPDLHAALELYERRISGQLRFQGSDIIRWLAEDAQTRSKDERAPHDFFLVAKFQRKVRAFVLFHFYPSRKAAFFAYMVVDRNTKGLSTNQLSNTLIARVRQMLARDRRLRSCESLLFEVEDPRKSPRSKQLEDIARIQRFCALAESQEFSLRSYDINYCQPQLSLPNEGDIVDEQPLLLLSARARTGPQDKKEVRSEVMDMLSFIYCDLYPEGFSPIQEEDDAYRAYCRKIYERAVAELPEKIKIINPAHLTCGRKVRQASKSRHNELTS